MAKAAPIKVGLQTADSMDLIYGPKLRQARSTTKDQQTKEELEKADRFSRSEQEGSTSAS